MALIGRNRSGSELALDSVRIVHGVFRFCNANVYVLYEIQTLYKHYKLQKTQT